MASAILNDVEIILPSGSVLSTKTDSEFYGNIQSLGKRSYFIDGLEVMFWKYENRELTVLYFPAKSSDEV